MKDRPRWAVKTTASPPAPIPQLSSRTSSVSFAGSGDTGSLGWRSSDRAYRGAEAAGTGLPAYVGVNPTFLSLDAIYEVASHPGAGCYASFD